MIIDHKLLVTIWESYGLGPSAKWAYTALVFELFNAFSRDGVITPSIAAKAISHRQLRSKLLNELSVAGLTQRVGDILLLSHFKDLTAELRVRHSVTTRFSKCHHSTQRSAVKTSLNRALRQEDFTRQAHSGFHPLCVLVHTCATPVRARARRASAGLGMGTEWRCRTQEGVKESFSKANRLNVAGSPPNEVFEPLDSADIDEGKMTQASTAVGHDVTEHPGGMASVHPDGITDSPKVTEHGANQRKVSGLNGNINRQRFSAQRPKI